MAGNRQWLTAAANPRAFAGGFDAGRHAWKRHAIEASDDESFGEVRARRAACGLLPRHGWDDDLFIPEVDEYTDYRCLKCRKKLGIPDGSGYAVALRRAQAL